MAISNGLGAMTLISTFAGSSAGYADTSVQLIRISESIGTSAGTGNATASAIRLYNPIGLASGKSVITPLITVKYGVLSGVSSGSTVVEAYIADRDVLASLSAALPPFLNESKTISSIQQAQGIEATRLFALAEQLLQDYFVDTASEDGISLREESLEIKPRAGKSLEDRRVTIKRRMKRPELLTKQRFKQQLRDYYVCGVEVKPDEYRVVSTILSKRGVPEDISEMEALVDQVLPAHLEHEFIPTYLPYGEAEAVGLTWGEAAQYSCEELGKKFLIPFVE